MALEGENESLTLDLDFRLYIIQKDIGDVLPQRLQHKSGHDDTRVAIHHVQAEPDNLIKVRGGAKSVVGRFFALDARVHPQLPLVCPKVIAYPIANTFFGLLGPPIGPL